MEAMPEDDAWDWPFLYYVGTVLLNMPERAFWRIMPRKLNELAQVHAQLNGSGETKPQKHFIDEIM